jgi:hypothetical protein
MRTMDVTSMFGRAPGARPMVPRAAATMEGTSNRRPAGGLLVCGGHSATCVGHTATAHQTEISGLAYTCKLAR